MGTSHLFNFSSSQITRFQQSAENKFTISRGSIIDRMSIALVAGTSTYALPDYVQQVRRITYLGWKIWPIEFRQLRNSFLSGTQQSRPYWYIFNGVPTSNGALQLQLFPVPSFNVSQLLTYTDFWGPGIINGVVIEYFRSPDFTGTKNRVPTYFMPTVANAYTNKRCFAINGPGQDLKASDYWSAKYETLKSAFIQVMDDLNNKPRNLVANDSSSRPYGYVPPPPILPQKVGNPLGSSSQAMQFGISVDEIDW